MSRSEMAQLWAQRLRRLEPHAMSWAYEGSDKTADLARRILAQTVGLRRLLDQMVTKENGL